MAYKMQENWLLSSKGIKSICFIEYSCQKKLQFRQIEYSRGVSISCPAIWKSLFRFAFVHTEW